MAVYTELSLAVELRTDTPAEVIDWIKFLVKPDKDMIGAVKMPDHPLFRERTGNAPTYMDIFHGSNGAAFAGTGHLVFELQDRSQTWHLTIRSALKNYQREIEAFLMWLMPYVEPNGFAGYYREQGEQYPCLIFYPELDKLTVIDQVGELIKRTNGQVRNLLADEDSE